MNMNNTRSIYLQIGVEICFGVAGYVIPKMGMNDAYGPVRVDFCVASDCTNPTSRCRYVGCCEVTAARSIEVAFDAVLQSRNIQASIPKHQDSKGDDDDLDNFPHCFNNLSYTSVA
jgi:hypothetical protein